MKFSTSLAVLVFSATSAHGATSTGPMEIYCNIVNNGANLSCQVIGAERKVMGPEDTTSFVDAGEVVAYVTLKSRKGMERTFLIDGKSPQYRKLAEIKRNGSISEIAKAKTDLFAEIEKRAIKTSDNLDNQALTAELILYDPSITLEKLKTQSRKTMDELQAYRENKEKACTSTPAYENITRANARFRQTLSNFVQAFATPETCMSEFKVFKDKDGSVDLRQLNNAVDYYRDSCKVQAKK